MESTIITEIYFQTAGAFRIKETVGEINAQRAEIGEKESIHFTIINTLDKDAPHYETQKDKEYKASVINALFIMVRQAESQKLDPKPKPKETRVVPGKKEDYKEAVKK